MDSTGIGITHFQLEIFKPSIFEHMSDKISHTNN